MQNCHGLMSGVLKFSAFISISAAEAISPTTVGRITANMLSTTLVSRYFIISRVIVYSSMNYGSTTATVAVTLPSMPTQWGYPTFTAAV